MNDILQRIESAIVKLPMQMAAQQAKGFYQTARSGLGIATEVFYRKEMGERYLGPEAAGAGSVVWFLTLFATVCIWQANPLVLALLALKMSAAAIVVGLLGIIGTLTTLVLFILFLVLCGDNARWIRQARVNGMVYHSRSPGCRRLGGVMETPMAVWIIGICLFIVALPLWLLYVLSRRETRRRVAEQQAALWKMYLDKMDQEVESLHLENAILGRCRPEITYLYEPLDPNLKAQIRELIAASNRSQPVSVAPSQSRAGDEFPVPLAAEKQAGSQAGPNAHIPLATRVSG
jgi:hypothetical protein